MKPNYHSLSSELQEKIQSEHPEYLYEASAIRRLPDHDTATIWRPCYVRDIEKILHSPYYNRYSDKTQVFSFFKNDDISRRALHVQLVSRIARNIGRLLGLNSDLIEAIALGHDIGHTPFGHAGERFLNQLYHENTGCYFNHNVHSVRVLDGIFHFNISLQTLDGILCHNGEFDPGPYSPARLTSFDEFDQKVEACYQNQSAIKQLVPSTLEGCVVRISDMVAYVGKDRQDAKKAQVIESEKIFTPSVIGSFNSMIINNLIVNIIENSYGKNCILMDPEYYEALKLSKAENNKFIYSDAALCRKYDTIIKPMFEKLYSVLMDELKSGSENTIIYKHHIAFVEHTNRYYEGKSYLETEPNQIIVDFIASMTDDYFIDLYKHYFPDEKTIEYISYFCDTDK